MDAIKSWLQFLHPETLKTNLLTASVYILAWDALCDCIVDQLKGFYWTGFNADGDITDERYETRVLARHKSPLQASLLWFKESNAIDDADIALVDRLRQHRNEIAHQLQDFIAGRRQVDPVLFVQQCELIRKIDTWWIRNIEIPTNPDFDDTDTDAIPDSEIMSGRLMFLQMLFKTALGDEQEANKFYESVIEQAKARGLVT